MPIGSATVSNRVWGSWNSLARSVDMTDVGTWLCRYADTIDDAEKVRYWSCNAFLWLRETEFDSFVDTGYEA
jgi:hypothetical protein